MRNDRLYYTIKDATYWYEIHGDGVPLVMLHGFTGSTATWKQFINKQEENLQIITVDLPGHGKTDVSSPRSMEDCCEDLKELLDHLQLDKFHLLGYSMGGRTALSFAMMYPGQVKSLILESASPGLVTLEEQDLRVEKDEKLARRIETEGLDAFVEFWEGIPLFASQKLLPTSLQQVIRAERLAQSEQGLSDSLRSMGTGKQPSWWNDLHRLNIPVLLLAGAYDDKFIQINRSMNTRLPNSTLEIIEQSGHAIHVEQSEIFGRIVTGFILTT
ncbi:2-succinyl-6-hydroxy-2,4-cyclohexadiene-1-carboxylate synthase [Virgibacillus halotolerans]|nr:2-succinyl-6-hydroxy-2,4-cyclohexadiene-1-carboxylate synthase [Virgibacillus halotolerans]